MKFKRAAMRIAFLALVLALTASSNPGDMILDPFAGCATACVSAERLGRHWVGIDLSPLAAKLVKARLEKEMGLFYDINHREDIPRRTDLGTLPNYHTHKHTPVRQARGDLRGMPCHVPLS